MLIDRVDGLTLFTFELVLKKINVPKLTYKFIFVFIGFLRFIYIFTFGVYPTVLKCIRLLVIHLLFSRILGIHC